MSAHERPSDALRARLLAAAAREPSTRPGTWRRRLLACGVTAAVWIGGVTFVLGIRPDWNQLPTGPVTQTLLVLVATAMLASAAGLARGRAMVGARSEILLAVVACMPVVLLGVVSSLDPRGPSTHTFPAGWATVRHSFGCELLVFMVAFPLVGLGSLMSRGLTLSRPILSGLSLGLGAATWAHAVVRVHCPVGGAGHAIVAHVLPAVPVMAAAAWVWARPERPSSRRDSLPA